MPPLTCCVLCSSPIWTCDPPWPSYYRGITLFSIKRVQHFCLFSNLLRKWLDLNQRPKGFILCLHLLLYHIELHSANIIIIRMTCSTVRWLHLYPYYLLSSYRTSPTMIFNLQSFTSLYFLVLITNHFWILRLAVGVGATPFGTWTIILDTL